MKALRFVSIPLFIAMALGAAAAQTRRLEWRDLTAPQGVAPAQNIELAGYLLPVDREGSNVYEFVLVPVPGACSHMPTPPPNQLVRVALSRPYHSSGVYEPVAVSGDLRSDPTRLQLFILDGVKVIDADYSIGSARVVPAPDLPPMPGLGNPMLSRNKPAGHP